MALKKLVFAAACALACTVAAAAQKPQPAQQGTGDLARHVNPFIGTGGHGHTFPGAVVPFGGIQPSPDTRIDGWDACSGYYYPDTLINGFAQTHLSGTGCASRGDFLILPYTGQIDLNPANDTAPVEAYGSVGTPRNRSYASGFSHATEKATPGYYGVRLDRYGVDAELTAAPRSAIYRFVFPESPEAGILFDVDYSIQNQYNRSMGADQTGPTTLTAHKNSGGWIYDQQQYIAAETSRPFEMEIIEDSTAERPTYRALLRFPGGTKAGEEVMLKLGLSAVDVEGARKNLDAEIPAWDFDKVQADARAAWNEFLGKMTIPESASDDDKAVFYTALYHTAMAPNIFTDVDNRYRGQDRKIHVAQPDQPIYTVFSLWDTHRALHPLFSIIAPEMNNLFARSLLAKGREGGIMPKWELNGNYTCCMPGYHSVALLADVAAKGQGDFDLNEALRAGERASRFDTTGINAPRAWRQALSPIGKLWKDSIGYIPYEVEHESVANGLEYAYDDYCIAVLAECAGDTAAQRKFAQKALNYKNYFDPATRFMRGKGKDGKWHEPFDPHFSDHRGDDYCEGTAFQWNWFVPHDPQGLIELLGGEEAFLQRLDSLFTAPTNLVGNVSPDIAGLIGQYAHGNEPSHHIIHLYNYAHRPDRVQELVSRVMREQYRNDINGLSGNEDCGQMSAWYLMNALGLYQVAAGNPVYSLGRPWFEEITVAIPEGRTLTVKAENFAPERDYVDSVTFNGVKLIEPFISHKRLMEGGELKFYMKESPVEFVNPFIGTTNYGATNPGALRPNGLMSVSPFNVMGSDLNRYDKDKSWWSAPYDNKNSVFTGFSHVNLSGVGCPDMGSLLLMGTAGPLQVDYHDYGTTYTDETANPGYYAVELDNGVKAEATATPRVGVTRFTFPAGKEGNILLNLGEGLTNETGATVRRVGPCEIEGSKLLGTFCYNSNQAVFPIYFAMRLSRKPSSQGYWKKQRPMEGVEAGWDPDNGKYKLYTNYGGTLSGDDIGVWYVYDKDIASEEPVEVQLAVSFVSTENAWQNLEAEAQGLNFDDHRAAARREWNDMLSRIEVEGGTPEQREVFYTALYHALIHPNLLQDVNGQYPAMESATGEVRTVEEGNDRYTVFSLWDTYRNLHQLLTLVYPEKQEQMVRSMVDMGKEWGWLPRWELFSRESYTMEGDPALPVIVDSYRKGLKNFDVDAAYALMRRSATTPGKDNIIRPDIDVYLAEGFVPVDTANVQYPGDNSVSHALEYYAADNALAWLARERGDIAFADSLARRVAGWQRYYDKEYGTLRPVLPDGTFYAPFNPRQGENFEQVTGFHEGSAWNYTFFTPWDVKGLAKKMGGDKKYLETLRKVFNEGLYDAANEPDIAYPYLFTHFKGAEHEATPLVHSLLDKHFKTTPDGLPGNEDTGTMSAWAIWSMMGLYPDLPGVPEYAVTTPVFDSVTIHLDPAYHNGQSKLVLRPQTSKKPIYRISHDQLLKQGGIK